ncbi:MAG: hypothetical protein LBB75_08465 [Oscillospiraceae bacterium]|nr:hypothetical protein [Oscillospiraceae bacterium]
MLGLGTWEFNVDTMFYRGRVLLMVNEKDGAYDIGIDIPGMDVPAFEVASIEAEGNTVTGAARTDLLRGKDIPFSITFDGDSAEGFLKVPFMGKFTMRDGKKIG